MKSLLLLIVSFSFVFEAQSKDLGVSPSDDVLKEIYDYNSQLSLSDPSFLNNNSPLGLLRDELEITAFSEWEDTGYLVFSDENRYESERIKRELVLALPENVKVVVYTQNTSESYHEDLFNYYSRIISPERVIVLKLPRGGRTSLWTRDNTPIAVRDQNSNPYLVDAKYYYNFEPDASFGRMYEIDLLTNPYFFEGGNLINNSQGDCIVVNRKRRYPFGTSDTAAIPDQVFEQSYGCTNLIRLEHIKGIGHADEVVKFLDDKTIVTDTEEYVDRLRAQGFDVHMLPEPRTSYGTYVNSLIVNNVIYVPAYEESGDDDAFEVYQNLLPNHRVVPIESSELSSNGQGGVHCITMTYPPYELKDLTEILGGALR
jgi:agmatine/peptidylarginine deiminase